MQDERRDTLHKVMVNAVILRGEGTILGMTKAVYLEHFVINEKVPEIIGKSKPVAKNGFYYTGVSSAKILYVRHELMQFTDTLPIGEFGVISIGVDSSYFQWGFPRKFNLMFADAHREINYFTGNKKNETTGPRR